MPTAVHRRWLFSFIARRGVQGAGNTVVPHFQKCPQNTFLFLDRGLNYCPHPRIGSCGQRCHLETPSSSQLELETWSPRRLQQRTVRRVKRLSGERGIGIVSWWGELVHFLMRCFIPRSPELNPFCQIEMQPRRAAPAFVGCLQVWS